MVRRLVHSYAGMYTHQRSNPATLGPADSQACRCLKCLCPVDQQTIPTDTHTILQACQRISLTTLATSMWRPCCTSGDKQRDARTNHADHAVVWCTVTATEMALNVHLALLDISLQCKRRAHQCIFNDAVHFLTYNEVCLTDVLAHLYSRP